MPVDVVEAIEEVEEAEVAAQEEVVNEVAAKPAKVAKKAAVKNSESVSEEKENEKAAIEKTEASAKTTDPQAIKVAVMTKPATVQAKPHVEEALPVQTPQVIKTETKPFVAEPAGPREPKSTAVLLLPERALAGQHLTVALLDEEKRPEHNVELSFNGVSLMTDANGQAVYQIPEDATPGHSLNIGLTSRPYDMPAVVDVLQPLSFGSPSTTQSPRLDKTTPLTAGKPSISMIVDGHNFDGIVHNNRIIIDGAIDGQVVAGSPVQLKFIIPQVLKPGLHTLVVSTQGMRSNPIPFEYAQAEVQVDAKENKDTNKVVVKVLGTSSKVGVKVINLSPDVIRLNSGRIISSGGADNNVVVPVQRIKKGTYKVQADIEL